VSPSTAPTAVMPVGLTGINAPATPAAEVCGPLSLLDVPFAARAAVERLAWSSQSSFLMFRFNVFAIRAGPCIPDSGLLKAAVLSDMRFAADARPLVHTDSTEKEGSPPFPFWVGRPIPVCRHVPYTVFMEVHVSAESLACVSSMWT